MSIALDGQEWIECTTCKNRKPKIDKWNHVLCEKDQKCTEDADIRKFSVNGEEGTPYWCLSCRKTPKVMTERKR